MQHILEELEKRREAAKQGGGESASPTSTPRAS
jgi:hypothetical protein